MVQDFRRMQYDESLKLLEWCTLEGRRLWDFKLINSCDIAAPDSLFHKSSSSLRGHTLKLNKCSFRTNIGK